MKEYLSNSEVNELITRIKSNDNDAWIKLCDNFARYIHERCWKKLRKFDITDSLKKDLEEDLYMAGWQGFINAVENYDPNKGQFLTYATYYIDGEISKELDLLLNPLGLTERPKRVYKKGEESYIKSVSLEVLPEIESREQEEEKHFSVRYDAPDRGKYSAERRTLQILEILRILTDDEHSLSKDELGKLLRIYRIAKYDNGTLIESANTITSTVENILMELDPLEYSKDKEEDYRVKYDGYKEDRLKKKIGKECSGKAPGITGFAYVHTFSNEQLDRLIELISFSDMISSDEKGELIRKLVDTASVYYRTPFWDGKKVKFNPKAVHGRFSGRKSDENSLFAANIKIIQYAINNLAQLRFKFNRYSSEKVMVPTSNYIHTLSPYHLVAYHDNYYCIGLKADDNRIWHYRVDLMSDIEIVKDEAGKIIPIQISGFDGLPIFNSAWNPEKYMAEHLNMAYDEPQDIRIKIRNTDYTIIHDWFGNHYEKVEEVVGKDDAANDVIYDIVKVRTSQSMIVHWAMQYGARVEIMDEEIRNAIRLEIQRMEQVYV